MRRSSSERGGRGGDSSVGKDERAALSRAVRPLLCDRYFVQSSSRTARERAARRFRPTSRWSLTVRWCEGAHSLRAAHRHPLDDRSGRRSSRAPPPTLPRSARFSIGSTRRRYVCMSSCVFLCVLRSSPLLSSPLLAHTGTRHQAVHQYCGTPSCVGMTRWFACGPCDERW